MKEQQPKLLGEIDTHKEGGLTPNHWRLILEKIDTSKSDKSAKIASYAQKVVSGEFPAKGFHHRKYLGKRHWDLIEEIGPDLEKQDETLGPEISSYCRFEKYGTYTLNDYLDLLLVQKRIWLEGDYSLVWRGKTWYRFHSYNYTSTDEDGERTTETITSEKEADENTVLEKWLLGKSDVRDPLHTSPENLAKILLAKARVTSLEEIQERLRRQEPYETNLWVRRAVHQVLSGRLKYFLNPDEEEEENKINERRIKGLLERYQQHYRVRPFLFIPYQELVIPRFYEKHLQPIFGPGTEIYSERFSSIFKTVLLVAALDQLPEVYQSWGNFDAKFIMHPGHYLLSSQLPKITFGQAEEEI